MGHRTYGKGSVQTVMPLASGGALKLTTSRYFTPSGVSIQGKGIVPDVLASGADVPPAALLSGPSSTPLAARDPGVRTALQTLKSQVAQARSPAAALTARNVFP